MKASFRSALFLVTASLSTFALGCAAEESADDQLDYDGEGKGDGVSSTSPDRLMDTPFYFGVPKTSVDVALERSKYPYPTLWNKSVQGDEVGLRVIAVKQAAGVEGHRAARREMAQKLAAAGVLKDGDIVLTFRPELAGSMAYPHIQMGSTHAGLVYTKDGAAFNIDSPLDSEYVGQFDTSHYAGNGGTDQGTDALHIIRPAAMDDARRAQLREWIFTLKAGLPRINGQRQQVKFQSDYLTPTYVSSGETPRQTVTTLGRIILEQDTTTQQPMFCSEFVWHMLALSSCTATEIRNAPPEGASCIDFVFDPMDLTADEPGEVGLADGPLLSIQALPAANRAGLVEEVFATGGNVGKLSSGHRAVSEEVAPLMPHLKDLFTARAAGAPIAGPIAAGATQLNANIKANYSPTAYIVAAMPDGMRSMDYVATVTFVGTSGYAKAKVLAMQPVP